MSTVWQDRRHGFRTLAKNKGFTLVAVLTLAPGIGAHTATFSVINALLLQPLPNTILGELVFIWSTMPRWTACSRFSPWLPATFPRAARVDALVATAL
jgi:hypothetical protein